MTHQRVAHRAVLIGMAVLGTMIFLRRDGDASASPAPQIDMAQSELQRAAQRAAMCSAANVVGVGLRGEYFSKERWQGASLLVRTDPSIEFDAALDWPADKAAIRPRSVRWTGWIKPPVSGRYRFHAEPAEASVTVAKQLLVGQGAAPMADIEMAAGRFYPIVVEVSALDAQAGRVRLEWTAPHGARYPVPRTLLNLPAETLSTTPRS